MELNDEELDEELDVLVFSFFGAGARSNELTSPFRVPSPTPSARLRASNRCNVVLQGHLFLCEERFAYGPIQQYGHRHLLTSEGRPHFLLSTTFEVSF